MRRRTFPPAPLTAARAMSSEIPRRKVTISSSVCSCCSATQYLDLVELFEERLRSSVFFRALLGRVDGGLRRAKPALRPSGQPCRRASLGAVLFRAHPDLDAFSPVTAEVAIEQLDLLVREIVDDAEYGTALFFDEIGEPFVFVLH